MHPFWQNIKYESTKEKNLFFLFISASYDLLTVWTQARAACYKRGRKINMQYTCFMLLIIS
jgi:hypothetical protein